MGCNVDGRFVVETDVWGQYIVRDTETNYYWDSDGEASSTPADRVACEVVAAALNANPSNIRRYNFEAERRDDYDWYDDDDEDY